MRNALRILGLAIRRFPRIAVIVVSVFALAATRSVLYAKEVATGFSGERVVAADGSCSSSSSGYSNYASLGGSGSWDYEGGGGWGWWSSTSSSSTSRQENRVHRLPSTHKKP
jgi:hypothetical protein